MVITGSCCLTVSETLPELDKFLKCVVISSRFAVFSSLVPVCCVFSPALSRFPKKPSRLLFRFPVRRTEEPVTDLAVTDEYLLEDSIPITLESILTLTSFLPRPCLCLSVPPTAPSVMHGNRKDSIIKENPFPSKIPSMVCTLFKFKKQSSGQDQPPLVIYISAACFESFRCHNPDFA